MIVIVILFLTPGTCLIPSTSVKCRDKHQQQGFTYKSQSISPIFFFQVSSYWYAIQKANILFTTHVIVNWHDKPKERINNQPCYTVSALDCGMKCNFPRFLIITQSESPALHNQTITKLLPVKHTAPSPGHLYLSLGSIHEVCSSVVVNIKDSAIIIPGLLPSPGAAAAPSSLSAYSLLTHGIALLDARGVWPPAFAPTTNISQLSTALQMFNSHRLSETENVTTKKQTWVKSTQAVPVSTFSKNFCDALMTLCVGPPCLTLSTIFHSTLSIFGQAHLHMDRPKCLRIWKKANSGTRMI